MKKLVIQGTLPSLNEIIRVAKSHPQAYANLKRQHTMNISMNARHQIKKRVQPPVELIFAWYCKDKRTDPDNLTAARKFIIDGLVESGVLEDDGWGEIAGFRDTWTVDKANPRIEVEITEATLEQ